MADNQKILHDIYYNPKTGLKGYQNFIFEVRKKYPDIPSKEVKEFYKKQELSQINIKPTLKKDQFLKITGPILSFQMDVMYLPEEFKNIIREFNSKYKIFT